LKAASVEEILVVVKEVTEDMRMSGFRKPIIKYKAEAIIHNKKPHVETTTRDAYKTFVAVARACAKDNSTMLQAISTFESKYLSKK
jgi:hypothetical protein